MIEIKLNSISSLYYVYKRPCDYFLQETSQWFELQIFTASVKEYADPIIDWLETEILDRQNKRSSNGSATTKSTTKPQLRRKFSLNDIIEMIVLIDQELDILKTFQNSLKMKI